MSQISSIKLFIPIFDGILRNSIILTNFEEFFIDIGIVVSSVQFLIVDLQSFQNPSDMVIHVKSI